MLHGTGLYDQYLQTSAGFPHAGAHHPSSRAGCGTTADEAAAPEAALEDEVLRSATPEPQKDPLLAQ